MLSYASPEAAIGSANIPEVELTFTRGFVRVAGVVIATSGGAFHLPAGRDQADVLAAHPKTQEANLWGSSAGRPRRSDRAPPLRPGPESPDLNEPAWPAARAVGARSVIIDNDGSHGRRARRGQAQAGWGQLAPPT